MSVIRADFPTRSGYRARAADEAVELTLYGEIVETRPRDFWSDEELPGEYIVQSEILKDLETAVQAGAKAVKLRINSVGGDAGVALTIHNRLREYAGKGVSISCVVDGLAASGGSLIMCAADKVEIYPASLVMIHKCWSYIWGAFNADDLRAAADANDAYDKAQAAVYTRKTGLSATVITHMMGDTTYMTGREAVDKGFADRLLDGEGLAIAASADKSALVVNGRRVALPKGAALPEGIEIQPPAAANPENPITNGAGSVQPSEDREARRTGRKKSILTGSVDIDNKPQSGRKEGGTQMATNLTELREENPALAAQVEADVRDALRAETEVAARTAADAERERIQGIDEIAHLFGADEVREAKYGATPLTAEKMAFEAAKKAAKTGASFLTALQKDAAETAKVGAAANEPEEPHAKTSDEELEDTRSAIKALLK